MAALTIEEQINHLKLEKEFVQNWMIDLLDAMETELDLETRVRLVEACGRGCFRRFTFKQEIAAKGQGSLERLIDAYRENFEVWREGDEIHIRYGEESPGCYCPAARFRPAKEGDLHCECTRATHQAIFETALGRPFQIVIVESVRRGSRTCHFVARLSE